MDCGATAVGPRGQLQAGTPCTNTIGVCIVLLLLSVVNHKADSAEPLISPAPLLLALSSSEQKKCDQLKARKRAVEIELRRGGKMKRMIALRKKRRQIREQWQSLCR